MITTLLNLVFVSLITFGSLTTIFHGLSYTKEIHANFPNGTYSFTWDSPVYASNSIGSQDSKKNHSNHPFANSKKVILLMCYKRLDGFRSTLESISQAEGIEDYHIVFTQSIDVDMPEYYTQIDDIINSEFSFPGGVSHIKTMPLPNDDSFSTNRKKFGSKKNSANNLANGMRYSFDNFPLLDILIVFEDDIIVSKDILNFFEASNQYILRDDRIIGATALALDRRYPWDIHRFNNMYQNRTTTYDASLISIPTMHNNYVIKVFAWSIRREAYPRYYGGTIDNLKFKPTDSTPIDPMFNGCRYCENYCTDHMYEWQFKDYRFVYPRVPRVTQSALEGMTESLSNSTSNPYWEGPSVTKFIVKRPGTFHL